MQQKLHEQNYRVPAEWAPHAATWLAWPHNADDWPSKFQPIPWVYCEIVRWLSGVEDVHILVNDLAAEKRATQMLKRQGANIARLHFHHWRTDATQVLSSSKVRTVSARSPSPTGSSTPGPSTTTGTTTTSSLGR